MSNTYTIRKTLLYAQTENSLTYENELVQLEIVYSVFLDMFSPEHSYSQPMHNHQEYEIYMVLRGSCHIETYDNKSLVVNEGNFIIIPHRVKHRITYESPNFMKLSLRFNMTVKNRESTNFYYLAEKSLKDANVYNYNKQMRDLLSSMLQNATETGHEYKTVIFMHSIPFIIEILRIIVGKTKVKTSKKYEDTRINQAVDFIRNNISASITVADVADYLHISTKQLTRVFTKDLGITPGNYIREFRIERIRELLTTTNLQLEDIVDIMDYPDTTSLIKAFKRVEGNTPLKYRASVTKSE